MYLSQVHISLHAPLLLKLTGIDKVFVHVLNFQLSFTVFIELLSVFKGFLSIITIIVHQFSDKK